MKKLVLIFAAVLPQFIYAQQHNFSIEGSFSYAERNGKVYYNYIDDGRYLRDSAVVKDGKFHFSGYVTGIQKANFSFIPAGPSVKHGQLRDSKTIYLEPGNFKIVANDSLASAKVEGSELNAEYADFLRATVQLNDYITTHPSSYFSLEALIKLMGPYVVTEKVDKLWAGLDPKLKDSYNGKIVAKMMLESKATDVGAKAPDFAQPDTSGKIVQLRDLKGKYVLVDFWASWCGPCRAENPNVLKAYNNFKDKNFTIIGISIDKDKDRAKWLKAIQDDHLPWTQLTSPSNIDSGAWKAYKIRVIPSNYLIDPKGNIIAKNLHGEELHKKLNALIK